MSLMKVQEGVQIKMLVAYVVG